MARGEELRDLLTDLLAGRAGVQDAPGQATDVAVPAPWESSSAPQAATSASTGWWWTLPGLLVGAALGLLTSRRRGVPGQPRRVLVDGRRDLT